MNYINLLELVAFISGLLVLKKIGQKFLKIVLIIVGYAAINEVAAFLYSDHFKRSNIPFYVVYSCISFTLFFVALKSLFLYKNDILIAKIFIFISVGSFIYEIIYFSGISKYPSNAMAISCVMLIFLCFKGLMQIFKNDHIIDLKYESSFWFLTACLFFHFFLLTYIFIHEHIFIKEIQIFNKQFITIANLIFYPITTIAFLCQLKKAR